MEWIFNLIKQDKKTAISLLSIIIAVLSLITSNNAVNKAQEANELSKKANELSKIANKITEDSNGIMDKTFKKQVEYNHYNSINVATEKIRLISKDISELKMTKYVGEREIKEKMLEKYSKEEIIKEGYKAGSIIQDIKISTEKGILSEEDIKIFKEFKNSACRLIESFSRSEFGYIYIEKTYGDICPNF